MGNSFSKHQLHLPLAYASTDNSPPVTILHTASTTPPATSQDGDPSSTLSRRRALHSLSQSSLASTSYSFNNDQEASVQPGAATSFTPHTYTKRSSTFSQTSHTHAFSHTTTPSATPVRPPLMHSFSLNDLDRFLSLSDTEFDFAFENEDVEDVEENVKVIRAADVFVGGKTAGTMLGLCRSNLVRLSPNVGLLHHITSLVLCCNSLSEIPAEIGHMKNLLSLSVSQNQLTTLPSTIGHLTKLTDLKASDNQLQSLPPTISNLKKLVNLELQNNKLTYLPNEIGGMKSLASIALSDNPLTFLPAELVRLKFLRKLRVDRCPLLDPASLPNPTPVSPPSLKELAARVIVRNQLPILSITPSHVTSYLASAHPCSFCSGPYFESYTCRYRSVERSVGTDLLINLPLEYRLCSPHWHHDAERLSILFCPMPGTSPLTTPVTSPGSSPILSRKTASNASGMARTGKKKRGAVNVGNEEGVTVPLNTLLDKTLGLPNLPDVGGRRRWWKLTGGLGGGKANSTGVSGEDARPGLRQSRSLTGLNLAALRDL
ncbi:hypothetical protein BC832DRAFT_567983 [Gaertneriomyces semiglobifer]|nr:hypothetical protein BC832DRAFT_567983 [Gaertneriomyces semiglobifer]